LRRCSILHLFYFQNIGLVAAKWLELADKSPEGIRDPNCLLLAQLHSAATDYPKSGLPVAMESIPKSAILGKPDWNADYETSALRYESKRWIGRLYREVHLPLPPSLPQPEDLMGGTVALDTAVAFLCRTVFISANTMDIAVYNRISSFIQAAPVLNKIRIERIWMLLQSYVYELRTICARGTLSQKGAAILTEEEAVAGTIVGHTSQPRARKEKMSQLREYVSQLVDAVTAELRSPTEDDKYEILKRAWIAYRLSSIRPNAFGSQSFRFIALHEIFDAIKSVESVESYE
jgi:RNA-dependent RNA polymerase